MSAPGLPVKFNQHTDEDGKRTYTAVFEDGTGLTVPSVTTILDCVVPNAHWMKLWISGETIASVKERRDAGEPLTDEVLDKHCRWAFKRKSDRGKDIGKQVHACIQKWHEQGAKLEDWFPLTCELEPEAAVAADRWFTWWQQQGFEPIRVEVTVFHRGALYAGTCDGLYLHRATGTIWLWDWKTSKLLSESFPLQAIAYAMAALDMGLVPRIDHVGIGRFGKDGQAEAWRSDLHAWIAPSTWSTWFLWFRWFRASYEGWCQLKEALKPARRVAGKKAAAIA